MTKKTQRSHYAQLVAEEKQISYDKAYDMMQSIKDKYHISFASFCKNRLFHYEGDALESAAKELAQSLEKKNNHAIKMISKATGWSKEKTIAEATRIKEQFHIGNRTYWLRQLYEKTDEEIREYKEKEADKKERRIQQVMNITGWSRDKVQYHMAYCNMYFNVHNIEYYTNFKCWDLSDDQLRSFAVDEDSRRLSKLYNKKSIVLHDKLRFDNTFKPYLGRKFWTNKDTSFEEFQDFTKGLDKIFCKPLTLSMGVGAKVIVIPDNEEELKKLYQGFMKDNELLAEEYIVQHDKMSAMYAGSVNTVRFTMLRENDICHRLWSFVRFGCNGIVDNFHGGGMAAAVDINTGVIISDAMNSDGTYFSKHPVSGIQFKGFQIPHWDKVLAVTDQAMKSQDYVNYVGWDIAICADKVVIVEGNSTPQVGVYQSILAPSQIGQKPIYERFLNVEPDPTAKTSIKKPSNEPTSKKTTDSSFLTMLKRKIKGMLNK